MKKNISLLIVLMVVLSSCKKFLDEQPTGSLTPETNVTSPTIARAFANSPKIAVSQLARRSEMGARRSRPMSESAAGMDCPSKRFHRDWSVTFRSI